MKLQVTCCLLKTYKPSFTKIVWIKNVCKTFSIKENFCLNLIFSKKYF